MSPSTLVFEAFRLDRRLLATLEDGRREILRCGDVFLKPAAGLEESSWVAEVCLSLESEAFIVPRPIRASDGKWVVDGWTAWEWFEGSHRQGDWTNKIKLCRDFHAALKGIPKPDFIERRDDPWSIADRMAHGEIPVRCHASTEPIIGRLLPLLEPSPEPNQVIHGDFTGNILYAEGHKPCVIDFSPYWRTAEFAAGVVVVDAIVWVGAPASLISESGVARSAIARAAVRRILEHDLHDEIAGRPNSGDSLRYVELIDAIVGS